MASNVDPGNNTPAKIEIRISTKTNAAMMINVTFSFLLFDLKFMNFPPLVSVAGDNI